MRHNQWRFRRYQRRAATVAESALPDINVVGRRMRLRGDHHQLIWKLGHPGYSARQRFGCGKCNINGTALQAFEKAWRSVVFQGQSDLWKFSQICAQKREVRGGWRESCKLRSEVRLGLLPSSPQGREAGIPFAGNALTVRLERLMREAFNLARRRPRRSKSRTRTPSPRRRSVATGTDLGSAPQPKNCRLGLAQPRAFLLLYF